MLGIAFPRYFVTRRVNQQNVSSCWIADQLQSTLQPGTHLRKTNRLRWHRCANQINSLSFLNLDKLCCIFTNYLSLIKTCIGKCTFLHTRNWILQRLLSSRSNRFSNFNVDMNLMIFIKNNGSFRSDK